MKFKFDSYIKSVLTDSVTFSIESTDNPPLNILDLTFALQRPFFQSMEKTFTPEEKQFFKEHRQGDLLAPDGNDAFETEGIMNFYSSAIAESKKNQMVNLLKYYIGEFNSELTGPVKKDKSGMWEGAEVYRYPVKMKIPNESDIAPELNLGNMNARVLIHDILGYEIDDDGIFGSASLQDLLIKIENVEDADYILNNNVRPDSQEGNMYTSGLSKERIKDILARFKEMVEWGIKNNYSKISWS